MSWASERSVHDSSSWTVCQSLGIGAASGSVPSLRRALRNLSSDDSLAACYPSPFELPLDHVDREREQARLGRTWEHLGFRHYRDGVFVCDPAAGELDSALNKLTKVVLG